MISLLLPTRQRPDNLKRLVDSINETASNPSDIELVTYIDDDDWLYEALDLEIAWGRAGGPRTDSDGLVNLSAMWNRCYDACHGDIIMHCGDDIVFRTRGWDDIVRNAFDAVPDKILFTYGWDGIQPKTFGTHGFVHRRWIEAVGYWLPPLFSSDFNDCYLNDVAKLIGRHRFIDIYTEHLHFCIGKAEQDLNTQERLARHERDRPQDLYNSPMVQQMIADAAERLRGAMREA